MFGRFGKPLASVVVAALVALKVALSDGITADEAVIIALALANAVLVYVVPLVPEYRWVKSFVGVAIAILTALATLILDGFSGDDAILLLLVAAQAAGVVGAPAQSDNGVTSRPVTADGYGLGDRLPR